MFKFSGENPDFKRQLKKFDPRDQNTWPALVAGVIGKLFSGRLGSEIDPDDIEQECLRQIEGIIALSEKRDESRRVGFICAAIRRRAMKCLVGIREKISKDQDRLGKLVLENPNVAASRRDPFSTLPVSDYRPKATRRGELDTLGRRHRRWESERWESWRGIRGEVDADSIVGLLTPPEYKVYMLVSCLGMTYEKAAEVLQVNPTAVASRVRKINAKLKKAGLAPLRRSMSGVPLAVSRASINFPERPAAGVSCNPQPDIYMDLREYREDFFDGVMACAAYLTAQSGDGAYFACALSNRNRIKESAPVKVSKRAA